MGGQDHAQGALPLGMTRYPLFIGLDGLRVRCRISRPLSGFGPRTVYPVAWRYTGPPLTDYKTINLCKRTVSIESCSVLLVRSFVCVSHHGEYASRRSVALHMTGAGRYIMHISALISFICHF